MRFNTETEMSENQFNESLDSFSNKFLNLKNEFKILLEKNISFLFSSIPELASIEVIQYAPYFNDGDACNFEVHNIHFYSKDYVEEKDEDDYGNMDFNSSPKNEDFKQKLKDFIYSNALFMEMTFKNHEKIIFTREGVEFKHYEHD